MVMAPRETAVISDRSPPNSNPHAETSLQPEIARTLPPKHPARASPGPHDSHETSIASRRRSPEMALHAQPPWQSLRAHQIAPVPQSMQSARLPATQSSVPSPPPPDQR